MNMTGTSFPVGDQTFLDLIPQPDGSLVVQLETYCRFMLTVPTLTPHHINIDKDKIASAVTEKINKFLIFNDGKFHLPDLEL